MNRKETFERSVEILVKAYFEGTLIHTDVCACAVGNLVAGNNDYKISKSNTRSITGLDNYQWEKNGRTFHALWSRVFVSCEEREPSDYEKSGQAALEIPEIANEIDSTGYTWRELMAIETAFMIYNYDKYGTSLNGDNYPRLMSVLDVLFEIHEVTEEEIQEQSRLAFVK